MNDILNKLAALSGFLEGSMKSAEAEEDILSDSFVHTLRTTYDIAKSTWQGVEPLDRFADQLVMHTGHNFPKDLFMETFKLLSDTVDHRARIEAMDQARFMLASLEIIAGGGIHIDIGEEDE
jgi:hypothetical protein